MTIIYQYVIYNKPKDYPNEFVVRQFEISEGRVTPKELIASAFTLEEARACIPPGLTQLPVFEQDDPVIEEVWM